jgi:hypothetical protein
MESTMKFVDQHVAPCIDLYSDITARYAHASSPMSFNTYNSVVRV